MTCKPYDIPKILVWEAWLHVKANQGAAGIDAETIGARLAGRLTRLAGSGGAMPSGAIVNAVNSASAARPFRQQQPVPKPCRLIAHEGRRYRSRYAGEDWSRASTWRARHTSRPNSRC
jgi:hypothetical protein